MVAAGPDEIGERLLQHNFLPRISASMEELAPCFTTRTFGLDTARAIAGLEEKRALGYDTAQIYATRFNLVQRQLGFPHPAAYASLVVHMVDNWTHYAHVTQNKTSRIRPHKWKDGRFVSMDPVGKARRHRVGARYLIEADIASCYPSIYTHSLAWALVGHTRAKAERFDKTAYFNQIDYYTRQLQRNETSGLLIGPGTSSVAAEIVLGKVDDALRAEGFHFSRFIDDYRFYAKSAAQGERFLESLTRHLATMTLQLNHRKTRSTPLPAAITPAWIRDLLAKRPRRKTVATQEALALLDYAIELTEEFPDASALKYALTTIEKTVASRPAKKFNFEVLASTLANLSFHRPVAIPFMVRILLTHRHLVTKQLSGDLSRILLEHAKHRRSDAVTWLLFLLHKIEESPTDKAVEAIVESRDCMSLLLLSRTGDNKTQGQVDAFVAELLSMPTEDYELDQYWPLLYDLYFQGRIANPYADSKIFEVMLAGRVELLDLTIEQIKQPGIPRGRDPYSLLV